MVRQLLVDERSRIPLSTTPENIAEVEESIYADCQKVIHDICDEAGIFYCTCQQILREDLKMYRITTNFIPRLLIIDQKNKSR